MTLETFAYTLQQLNTCYQQKGLTFPLEYTIFTNSCFSSAQLFMFLINNFRYVIIVKLKLFIKQITYN